LALAALTLVVAACTEEGPLGGTPTQVAGQPAGTLPQNQPATPPPQAIASPKQSAAHQVATPTPLNLASPPPASPSPVPLPVSSGSAAPGTSPSPTASTSPDPSASPTPSPSPSPFSTTGVATDLAVSGPAYFVLSAKINPDALEDLVFTRHGHFKMVTEGSNHYLKHADHKQAFYVLGYARTSTADDAPDETHGISEAVMTTNWAGSPTMLSPVSIDLSSDSSKVKFSIQGELLVNSVNPGGRHTYVGLAQFEKPEFLTTVSGVDRFYRYTPNALQLFMGVAVTGPLRPVGNHPNFILVEQLNGN
jgi:hypothetical protein